MLNQSFSQRIKARSGPGGIFLIQAGLIEKLPNPAEAVSQMDAGDSFYPRTTQNLPWQ